MPGVEMEYMDFTADIKASDIGVDGTFRGHASVFGNRDSHGDIVERGAFVRSLKKKTPKVLYQHDFYLPIGKSLKHEEDKKGLAVEAQLIVGEGVQKADETHVLMKHGIIDSLSIGYFADPKKQRFETVGGKNTRFLQELDLWEYSPVTFASNQRARITRVKTIRTPRQMEVYLRDEGNISWEAAKFITAHIDFEKLDAVRDGQATDPWDGGKVKSEAEMLKELAVELRKANPTFS